MVTKPARSDDVVSTRTAGEAVSPDPVPHSRPAQRDLVEVMGRLARLRDADVLTEEEFQRERVKVVEGWTPPEGRPANDSGRNPFRPTKPATSS
jgi:hypothetical protein